MNLLTMCRMPSGLQPGALAEGTDACQVRKYLVSCIWQILASINQRDKFTSLIKLKILNLLMHAELCLAAMMIYLSQLEQSKRQAAQ